MNLKESIRRILREDSRVYDYDPERNTVPFDERLPFDVDKLLSVGAVFITPAIDGDPKSKTYKKWLNEPYVHLITLKNVFDSNPDSWIHKAITKKGDPESYRKDFVYKFYDGKYNQILWSLEKLGIDPNDMIEDKDNSIQESIRRILREETAPSNIRRRTKDIDTEFEKTFGRYYIGEFICERYDDANMYLRVITEAIIENLYWHTFYMEDDTSEEWARAVDFIYEYIKLKYGEEVKEYYNRVCKGNEH